MVMSDKAWANESTSTKGVSNVVRCALRTHALTDDAFLETTMGAILSIDWLETFDEIVVNGDDPKDVLDV